MSEVTARIPMPDTPSTERGITPWHTTSRDFSTAVPPTPPCLIIAAGAGSRLRQAGPIKPLHPILGIPLIERAIRTAHAAGVDTFYVVVGHEANTVARFLESLACRLGVTITPIFNPHWHLYENGYSVLLARDILTEPFLLLMSDHLFDDAILTRLLSISLPPGGIALAVDGELNNPLVDHDDVCRVYHEGGLIRDIGKHLTRYNGYDTGAFLCSPALFTALEDVFAEGQSTLSDAVRRLAVENRALAIDVSGCFWIDVDTPEMIRKAEDALLTHQGVKVTDGPVARYLNRPFSSRLTRRLVRYPITPNQITVVAFALSLLAAGLFTLRSYPALALGGIIAQLASIVDGCDGEVARLKYQRSSYGGWLDAVLDRYADGLLLFGLTWYAAAHVGAIAWWVGFLAILGSFMVSYTADKYDHLMKARVQAGARGGIRIGRDIRLFLVFIGAITNLPLAVLGVLAVVMNAEAIRRVFVCRDIVEQG